MTRSAFALTDVLTSVVAIVVLASLAIPGLGMVRGDSMLQESIDNLRTLSVAHVMYAADWDGRQVTWTRDDLAEVADNVGDYNNHPPVIAGWCDWEMWAYWQNPGHYWVFYPIGWPGCEDCAVSFGNFRLTNSSPFHEYVNGRFFDPTFYAPKDTMAVEEAMISFDDPCEFDPDNNPPVWISYVMSPAAMYAPEVMRSNAAGGWQDPWDIGSGFRSPGFLEAEYPSLKTLMIEHNWLQDPPGECNPGFDPIFGNGKCNPYLFNHGVESEPVALFYDGGVRLLPNAEVLAADQQILKQTGGVDGLWHRGTPFAEDGYYIPWGYDDVPLSHHILTTDGILGRDTLSEFGAAAAHAKWRNRKMSRPGPGDQPENDPMRFNKSLTTAP